MITRNLQANGMVESSYRQRPRWVLGYTTGRRPTVLPSRSGCALGAVHGTRTTPPALGCRATVGEMSCWSFQCLWGTYPAPTGPSRAASR